MPAAVPGATALNKGRPTTGTTLPMIRGVPIVERVARDGQSIAIHGEGRVRTCSENDLPPCDPVESDDAA